MLMMLMMMVVACSLTRTHITLIHTFVIKIQINECLNVSNFELNTKKYFDQRYLNLKMAGFVRTSSIKDSCKTQKLNLIIIVFPYDFFLLRCLQWVHFMSIDSKIKCKLKLKQKIKSCSTHIRIEPRE